MKSLLKYFALAILAASSTMLAHATTLQGQINMSSNPGISATINSTGITFYNNITMTGTGAGTGAESTTYGTGDFSSTGQAAISPNDSVNLPDQILISSLPGGAYNGTNATAGYKVFQFTQVTNGVSYVYTFRAYTATQFTGSVPGYSFFGILTQMVNGVVSVVNTTSQFDITNAGSVTNIAFSSTNFNPTPEPNSLILLGTGLVGAAGMVMRKRRVA